MNLFNTVKSFNPNLKIGGMFFTQWNGRKNVSKSVYALLEQYFGKYIMPVSISTSKDMEECTLTQEPLLEYSPNSKVAKEYLKLTEYILNHGNETF